MKKYLLGGIAALALGACGTAHHAAVTTAPAPVITTAPVTAPVTIAPVVAPTTTVTVTLTTTQSVIVTVQHRAPVQPPRTTPPRVVATTPTTAAPAPATTTTTRPAAAFVNCTMTTLACQNPPALCTSLGVPVSSPYCGHPAT